MLGGESWLLGFAAARLASGRRKAWLNRGLPHQQRGLSPTCIPLQAAWTCVPTKARQHAQLLLVGRLGTEHGRGCWPHPGASGQECWVRCYWFGLGGRRPCYHLSRLKARQSTPSVRLAKVM